MEEQVLTKKQYKFFKFVRGWLMALFVISIIGALGTAILFIFVFALPVTGMPVQTLLSFLAMILFVLASAMLGALLVNRGANRKNLVSATMLIFVAAMLVLSIFDTFTSAGDTFHGGSMLQPASSLTALGVTYVFMIAGQAIYFFFAVLLFMKTRQIKTRKFPNKALFIVYVAIEYGYMFTYIALMDPAGHMGRMIALGIVSGFLNFMLLFPIITLYKALDDDVFYEHFIVINPAVAIGRYEKALYGPVETPQAAAGYCVRCGSPLQPGAAFCGRCGHKVGETLKNKEE